MNSLIIILTGILGATLTFYVSEKLEQGQIRASALLSLFVGLFFYFFPNLMNTYLTENIPVAFFGASFIGMVSSNVIKRYAPLAIAGALFSIIYLNQPKYFDGFGGALGTSAFIALLAVIAIFYSTSKLFRKF
jgi:hypothetical protein